MGQDIEGEKFYGFPVEKVFAYLSNNGLSTECKRVTEIIDGEDLEDVNPFNSKIDPAIEDLYRKVFDLLSLPECVSDPSEDEGKFGLLSPSSHLNCTFSGDQIYFVFGSEDDRDNDFEREDMEAVKWPKEFGKLEVIEFDYLSV